MLFAYLLPLQQQYEHKRQVDQKRTALPLLIAEIPDGTDDFAITLKFERTPSAGVRYPQFPGQIVRKVRVDMKIVILGNGGGLNMGLPYNAKPIKE